jgi:hypothetical protein
VAVARAQADPAPAGCRGFRRSGVMWSTSNGAAVIYSERRVGGVWSVSSDVGSAAASRRTPQETATIRDVARCSVVDHGPARG